MNDVLTTLIPVIKEGLSMMLVGMGTVLVFLCIMIIAMHIMSACVRKLNEIFPEPVAAGANVKKKANNDDSEVAAAIVAAMFRGT